MTEKASYDLMIMLDPEAPEERRTELVGQIRGQIESGATLKGDADWGMRRLAYEIDHRTEAQYHLYQFESAPDLLPTLDRGLSIDDAVLRFRIIRLPGDAPEETPKAPPQTSFESGNTREGREGRGGRDRGDRGDRRPSESPAEQPAEETAAPAATEAPAAPPAEAPAAPPAEAPAETVAEAPAAEGAEEAPEGAQPAGDTA